MANNGYDQTYEDDKKENEETRNLILNPIKRGAQHLKEKLLGTEEQNRKGQEMLDKQAKEGSGIAKALGGKGMKSGGKVSSASKRADGCCVKGKTKGRYL
jgi:hypothetical protein